MLLLNGVKWRKKRFGENRNDCILGSPVCLSPRFSGWILNEKNSLSLSPCHRGWSHSWHSTNQNSPLRVLLLQVYREGAALLLLLPSLILPASTPYSCPMRGLGLILWKCPDLKETVERLIQSLPFMQEERSVNLSSCMPLPPRPVSLKLNSMLLVTNHHWTDYLRLELILAQSKMILICPASWDFPSTFLLPLPCKHPVEVRGLLWHLWNKQLLRDGAFHLQSCGAGHTTGNW